MKIKEVIERECCQNKDLKQIGKFEHWFRCEHCGKIWQERKQMDCSGHGYEWILYPRTIERLIEMVEEQASKKQEKKND